MKESKATKLKFVDPRIHTQSPDKLLMFEGAFNMPVGPQSNLFLSENHSLITSNLRE